MGESANSLLQMHQQLQGDPALYTHKKKMHAAPTYPTDSLYCILGTSRTALEDGCPALHKTVSHLGSSGKTRSQKPLVPVAVSCPYTSSHVGAPSSNKC